MADNIVQGASFTLFSSLPEELRAQIFTEAISLSPRIVEICQMQPGSDEAGNHHPHNELDADDTDDSGIKSPKLDELEISKKKEPDEASGDVDVISQDVDSSREATGSDNQEDQNETDSNSDSDSSSSNSPSSSDDEEQDIPPNTNSFYSSTPIPPLLHTSQEARAVALRYYTLSFPNRDLHPAKIYYNPRIDTLYFPTWSFPANTWQFESTLSPEVKSTIRRIAIDNLMWFSSWETGSINCTFQIDSFKNVEEVILVNRSPDKGCGCCMEFDRPELGLVEFDEIEVSEYDLKCFKDIREQFVWIKEKDPSWNTPQLIRAVGLKRDGVPM